MKCDIIKAIESIKWDINKIQCEMKYVMKKLQWIQ